MMFFGEDGETLEWLQDSSADSPSSLTTNHVLGFGRGSQHAGGTNGSGGVGGEARAGEGDVAEESFLAGLRAIALDGSLDPMLLRALTSDFSNSPSPPRPHAPHAPLLLLPEDALLPAAGSPRERPAARGATPPPGDSSCSWLTRDSDASDGPGSAQRGTPRLSGGGAPRATCRASVATHDVATQEDGAGGGAGRGGEQRVGEYSVTFVRKGGEVAGACEALHVDRGRETALKRYYTSRLEQLQVRLVAAEERSRSLLRGRA
ncbi:hypothetical protein T484DRAFT_2975783 [Baffinella frigidus]|nr:hypothetical protein T484DRAFT_2975783 [Cryptophyta sp. CCMP2293]